MGSVAFDADRDAARQSGSDARRRGELFRARREPFAPVRVVAIVGDDFTAKDESVFQGRRIDLAAWSSADGKTFFWAGTYSQNMNERTTLATDLNVFAKFPPHLPDPISIRHIFFSAISIRRSSSRFCTR